ncbi:UvrY/SirA/GacA family response regulator transcription factor [Xenorhabdus szentirmaii]|uniref:Response regulator uvrY n=2 Tax=Xenorhabdus szentirmaii TaxID=290112 RepID=W1J680_9GAMM|nr:MULTISPECIES: UvrY/SirA/GacA family response regulator transcription factor [Xenorhabdus]MBD2780373.1 UvrY/SirA/GacA family response regulator transcription factor [Xenorhabdus sp. 38]MBD2793555.1 UvrY/SirA/GacA family response regulator transcription factor [Xenorhabdus sp. CUL]MBD2799780.1 UvrY/SirA/GacA family response regulator transcription factor [Xenorhabdus sp. M]MBD2803451.1 UvrY/SirA/GacA family response regulator transcription factor [Xenorhabdus sp. ZM]MBD2821097.1 UvrY/SirA/Gac
MINVLLVDDHELVRIGVKGILDDVKGIKVVGEACNGESAVKWCKSNSTDIVIMDMDMPGMGGLEAAKKIIRYSPDIRVIMLTIYTESSLTTKVMQAGIRGYLSKAATPQDMINAIRVVYAGQRYISPEIAQKMALNQLLPQKENPLDGLSERELQIMTMITQGRKVNEISTQLNLSPKTVNSYRYRMFSKLNIKGDVELTHIAIRCGLLDAQNMLEHGG